MSTPYCLSSRAVAQRPFSANPAPPSSSSADWRCTCCGKKLGLFQDGRLHVRFTRSHEYLVSLPAQATCRGCGTLNEAAAPKR